MTAGETVIKKLTKVMLVPTNLREKARGRDCQIRLIGICNFDPATSVLAHLNGAGMGMKHDDVHASISCAKCHAAVDGASTKELSADDLELALHQGIRRTQSIWIEAGFLVVV